MRGPQLESPQVPELWSAWWAAQITINRPERRNAFRPQTTAEMIRCFDDARNDPAVGVVVLTGVRKLGCATFSTCVWGRCTNLRSADPWQPAAETGRVTPSTCICRGLLAASSPWPLGHPSSHPSTWPVLRARHHSAGAK